MLKYSVKCIDGGSEYCPCELGVCDNCMICSQMQGKEFCDCNWQGTCIYYEYVMNGMKSKAKRNEYICSIVEKKVLNNKLKMLILKVSKNLVINSDEPGSYIFIRGKDTKQYYNLPLSVFDVDKENQLMYLVYEIVGSKTKKLDSIKDDFILRGPYWNGIFGIENLKNSKGMNWMIVAKGIGQVPTLLSIKKLCKNNNKVYLLIDKGDININFVQSYIQPLNGEIFVEEVHSINENQIKEKIDKLDIKYVLSCGSDILHNKLLRCIETLENPPQLSITNNYELCCGEGICGGCNVRFEEGLKVRACKAQILPTAAIKRRILND